MEKLYEFLKAHKKTVCFIAATLLLWVLITIVGLAILDYSSNRLLAINAILLLASAVPAVVFAVSGAACRVCCGKSLAAAALCLVLELAASAMPVLFMLLDLHMFWDYPIATVWSQAALSVGPFAVTYLITALVLRKKA